jgi:hypothetical protein
MEFGLFDLYKVRRGGFPMTARIAGEVCTVTPNEGFINPEQNLTQLGKM